MKKESVSGHHDRTYRAGHRPGGLEPASRRRRSTLAAVAVWALAGPILGTSVVIRFGDGAPQAIGIELVVIGSLTGSLLGLGSLVVLEKFTSRARTIWTAVAIGVLLVSLSLPLVAGTTASTKAALALII